MSQATITIKKVWVAEHDSQYGDGKYRRYDVQPREDDRARYTTTSDELGKQAQDQTGRKVVVTYEEAQDGKKPKLTGIVALEESTDSNGSAPQPGTGDYVKGKEAPETQRSIAASVALREAVAHSATGGPEHVLAVADSFYDWLMSKVGAPLPSSQDEEARARLVLFLDELGPPAEGADSWTTVAQRYCKDRFGKASSADLTGAEAEKVIEHLKQVKAEEGIPF